MIKLKDVSLKLGEKQILDKVSLDIEDNKFTVITGPNGGGKTSLAKIIAGIYQPDSGKIFLDDVDITGKSITERAKLGMSYAFQQPVRFKGITVRELIEIAKGEKLADDEICNYLMTVGLCANEYINREVNDSLSGGEIKRIEIAMAAARNSKIIIFDEPEAGIDLWSFKNLIDIFKNLKAKTESSIIIISHQERILDIADEIVVISGGKILKKGAKDEIYPSLTNADDKSVFCPKEA